MITIPLVLSGKLISLQSKMRLTYRFAETTNVNISGQGSAPNAEAVGLFAEKMADIAWDIASRSNIPETVLHTAVPPSGTLGKRLFSTYTSNSTDSETGELTM